MRVVRKYRNDPEGLVKYYQDDLELVYCERSRFEILFFQAGPGPFRSQFLVDTDLAALGISSNRKLETLEKLINLLDDPARADRARFLLGRYTLESFATSPEWRAWFTQNRERLFFTDVGGYKFMVKPPGR